MYQSTHIGNCEFWLENNGAVRLYSHNFGQSSGFSTRMSSEEAMQLLEWLSQHHEEIAHSSKSQSQLKASAVDARYSHL